MLFSLPQSAKDAQQKNKIVIQNKRWEMNKSKAKRTLE